MSTGLIIGKFMPPHAGHLRLCAVAAAQVDKLHVVLFSKPSEPIPGALRLEWLRELLPTAHLAHVTAEHTVDFDDPLAWRHQSKPHVRAAPPQTATWPGDHAPFPKFPRPVV